MLRIVHLVLAGALLAVLLAGCTRLSPPEQSGELVVAIRSGLATYVAENGKTSGYEYDLIEAFAASRRWRVRYVIAEDQARLRSLLQEGKVHFAASAWIDDDPAFAYSRPLREARPVLVGSDVLRRPAAAADLRGRRIAAMYGSPQVGLLQQMAGKPPLFEVELRTGVAEFDLLREVSEHKIDFAAADSLQFNLALHYLPDLEVALTLPGTIRYGWAFPRDADPLLKQVDQFIAGISTRNGLLDRLRDRYFGNIERVGSEGLIGFYQLIGTRLPRYRRLFEDAQAATAIDWRLLAALAFQESKWDPLATSPTNVRGMMMLTEDTADRLGVSNRLDPRQSILAGARYLADLRDLLPAEVREPDRTWLALAAYNLGMGHLNAARTIATQLKRDPNSWYEMKQVLPLLSRPEYYMRLKSGLGRGGEAVIMVENIRTYADILTRFQPAAEPALKFRLGAAARPYRDATLKAQ